MNNMQRFHEGDRVITTHPSYGLPPGSCGTIESVFISVDGVYLVLFEVTTEPRIAYQSDLKLVAPAAAADRR